MNPGTTVFPRQVHHGGAGRDFHFAGGAERGHPAPVRHQHRVFDRRAAVPSQIEAPVKAVTPGSGGGSPPQPARTAPARMMQAGSRPVREMAAEAGLRWLRSAERFVIGPGGLLRRSSIPAPRAVRVPAR